MGRLILFLIGAFIAVMVVLWAVHALLALFMIAAIVLVGLAVVRLAFWSGRKSRR
jgi:hypothetical protein